MVSGTQQVPTWVPSLTNTQFSSVEVGFMKIRPLYDRIVVKRIEQKEQMQGGLYIPDLAKEKPQEGEVAAVGKGKRLEDGKVVPLDFQVATGSCLASIPAATSSWMAKST